MATLFNSGEAGETTVVVKMNTKPDGTLYTFDPEETELILYEPGKDSGKQQTVTKREVVTNAGAETLDRAPYVAEQLAIALRALPTVTRADYYGSRFVTEQTVDGRKFTGVKRFPSQTLLTDLGLKDGDAMEALTTPWKAGLPGSISNDTRLSYNVALLYETAEQDGNVEPEGITHVFVQYKAGSGDLKYYSYMKVNTSSMSLSTPAAHNQDEAILAATGDMMYRTDDVTSGVSTAGKYMHGFKINAAGTPISGAMEFGTLEGATEDDFEFSKVNVTLPTITNAAMRVEDATTDAGIASVSVNGSTITIKVEWVPEQPWH